MEEMYAEARREGRRLTRESVIKNVQLPPGEGGLGCDRPIARTAHSTLPDGVKNPVGAPKRNSAN